jgi:hypothetical protein
MRSHLIRLLEEFFPFIFFMINKHKTLHRIQREPPFRGKLFEYSSLSVEKLSSRLAEEHERAVKIDEKTSKFTLGLSVSLTILVTFSGALVKLLPASGINWLVILLCGFSSIFMMIAGIVSLGALKTLPKYGYGTQHLLMAEKNGACHLAGELILQEDINTLRHLRNETAYQCLRNGFIILLIALILAVFLPKIPVYEHGKAANASALTGNAGVEKIKRADDKNTDKRQVDSIRERPNKAANDSRSRSDN